MENTIRVLVATDNHVGAHERDSVRGEDSWKTFHEIMCLARERDVDMVLLGGDLFHENVPSRKSMYNVMRSLRLNCYGDKPCALEMLSDGTEHFDTAIGHANYEDTNINVAIPVFSIHGNHDDPSGEGHFAALDLLEMSGLINYFGRVPENDKINVRPLLLQKGTTKLALYGVSNVRDERMYRTFRDGHVNFFQPSRQKEDWFNIGVVHQNHVAHTATSYLPESFLPGFLDLVIWGHEHECDIQPHQNPEMGFKVMQPGSSIATSLIPGEAVPKKVTILSITGRQFKSDPIRLTTVRPFVYKDFILSQDKSLVQTCTAHDNHRHLITQRLQSIVGDLIKEAKQQYEEALAEHEQNPSSSSVEVPEEMPLPLIRLRVDTSPIPGKINRFDVENPQRFSNRFLGKVANPHDVLQLHQRKRTALSRKVAISEETKELLERPELAENVKVAKLVQDFLQAQSLTILPQNYFGDAVRMYIDKDDKHAMDLFVNDSLAKQLKHLVSLHEKDNKDEISNEDELVDKIEAYRNQLEEQFSKGQLKSIRGNQARYNPKPRDWNDELDGDWFEQPAALKSVAQVSDDNDLFNDDENGSEIQQSAARARGRGRGARGSAASSTRARGGGRSARSTNDRGRGTAAANKKTNATTTSTRSRTARARDSDEEEEEEEEADNDDMLLDVDNDDEEEEEDIVRTRTVNISDDDDDDDDVDVEDTDSQAMFVPKAKPPPKSRAKPATTAATTATTTTATKRGAAASTTNGKAGGSRASTPRTTAATATPARGRGAKTATTATATTRKRPARAAAVKKQGTLNFTASQASILGNGRSQVAGDDIEDSDDDEDAFEEAPVVTGKRKR